MLDDVPPVLSLGQLRRECGFRYVWEDDYPFLQDKKTGRKIQCHVIQDVPMVYPAALNADGKVVIDVGDDSDSYIPSPDVASRAQNKTTFGVNFPDA